jgi:3-phosphoshikimate 1-carboxyvinyltransferase
MPDLTMKVEPGLLQGTIIPPPSKSDAHRALICACLAGSPESVSGISEPLSDDILTTLSCMRSLLGNESTINCHESGTTLRLMVPLAAALGRQVEFVGSGRLPQRPLREYISILSGHGAELEFRSSDSLPVRIKGALSAGRFLVPGNISSQYVSGLLLALPLLEGNSEIFLTSRLESAPYVDMTIHTMQKFGVHCFRKPDGFYIPGNQSYHEYRYQVEADYSQAAFWLTAEYAGSRLTINGLVPNSVQGDRAITSLLADFRLGRKEYEIDVSQVPDLVPILAVAAALTPAKTSLINAARLRLKESDRLTSTRTSLNQIGAEVYEKNDGLVIYGGKKLSGGSIDSFGDHRIAMALAIAALSTSHGVIITGANAVSKSYPDFFEQLKRLGGKCHELVLD